MANDPRVFTAPTTEAVVALIQMSKKQPLRQSDRHIIKDLLTDRDYLAKQVDNLRTRLEERK